MTKTYVVLLVIAALAAMLFVTGCTVGGVLNNTLDSVTGVDDGNFKVEAAPTVALISNRLRITIDFSRAVLMSTVIDQQTLLVTTQGGVPIAGTIAQGATTDIVVWTSSDVLNNDTGAQLNLTLVGSPQLHDGDGVIQATATRASDGATVPGPALDGNNDNLPGGDYMATVTVPAPTV